MGRTPARPLWHSAAMPAIDLVDETFIAAPRERLAIAVSDRGRWAIWWPGLRPVVFMDRGLDGIRWSVSGELIGSCEIWLEEIHDGALLHYYLRADPTTRGSATVPRDLPNGPRGWRMADALRRSHALSWKSHAWRLKDDLEDGRRPGEPALAAAAT